MFTVPEGGGGEEIGGITTIRRRFDIFAECLKQITVSYFIS